jgi:hypothetical protein
VVAKKEQKPKFSPEAVAAAKEAKEAKKAKKAEEEEGAAARWLESVKKSASEAAAAAASDWRGPRPAAKPASPPAAAPLEVECPPGLEVVMGGKVVFVPALFVLYGESLIYKAA